MAASMGRATSLSRSFENHCARLADPESLHAAPERADVVVLRALGAGGIARIVAAHHAQHQREVLGGGRERPALVERRGEGDHAVARDAPVGRAQAAHARERRGLADRAAGVGAGGGGREPGGHRRGRAARAAAGNRALVPGVAHRAEVRGLVRRAHGELVHVGLAEQHRARGAEALDHVRVVGGDEVGEHARAARGAPARGAEEVLVRDRDPGERMGVAGRAPRVGRARLGEALVGVDGDEGVEARVVALDPREARARELHAGKPLRGELARELGQGRSRHRGSYSITFGTRYRPSSTCGAAAW